MWQSSALVNLAKILSTGLDPIGDDVEPIEALREDVEKSNDEDEKPLEAEVPQSKNGSEESQESGKTRT